MPTKASNPGVLGYDVMTPENPEAVITIIIAGIGYGLYIGAEAMQKKRDQRASMAPTPARALTLVKSIGAVMMVLPILAYVGAWVLGRF